MENLKFEMGQKVIYKGLIGIVESRFTYGNNDNAYGLVAEEDKELSCTAHETECELYIGQDIDQSEALRDAQLSSMRIQNVVGKITDKYFHDGTH